MIKHWFDLKSFLLFFVALWLALAGVWFVVSLIEESHLLEHAKEQQHSEIEKSIVTFEHAFKHAKQDVLYLTALSELGLNISDSPSLKRQRLAQNLQHFLATHTDYSHIRFIDQNGMEIVRVDVKKEGVINVPESQLTDAKNDPHIIASRSLPKGEVYLSEFDLNPHGDKVSFASTQIIRLITPVFDAKGQRAGLICANLKGDEIFQKMAASAHVSGMKIGFFDANDNKELKRIDSSVPFISSMGLLSQAIRAHDDRMGSLIFNDQLYSYYAFSPNTVLRHEQKGKDQELLDKFPWILVTGLAEPYFGEKLLINRVNPWVFWGLASLFVLILSLLFSHLRSSKVRFEMMLERQVALFDGFFKNTPNAYLIKGLTGKSVYFNHVACELFGQGDDLSGKTYQDLKLSEADKFIAVEKRVIESAQPVEFEVNIHQTPFHVTTFPIFDSEQRLILVGCIVADQSQSLKKAEKSLSQKTHLLEAMSQTQNRFMNIGSREISFDYLLSSLITLTNSQCGLIGEIEADDKGRLYIRSHAIVNMHWNPELQEFSGESINSDTEEIRLESLFSEVVTEKKVVIINDMETDQRACEISGSHIPLNRFLGLPVFYRQKIIGVICIANSDSPYNYGVVEYISPLLELYGQMIHITQVQKEKQEISNQLASKEQWLSMVINTAPDGILLVNKKGKIVLANQSVNHLFGYEEGLALKDIDILIPEYANHDGHYHYMHGEEKKQYIAERVVDGFTKSGEVVPIEIRLSPVINDQDESYVVCTVRDIRARIETEKRLRQSQKMEAIGQFTGGMAHDFNNLLGIIQGNLDLARMSIEDGENQSALVEVDRALEASGRSAKLIQRLLAFARKQPLTPKLISLEQTLLDLIPLLEQALGKNISLTTQLAKGVGLVKIDPSQFENALINLAVNARDAMAGEGRLTITVSHQLIEDKLICIGGGEIQQGQYALVQVKDTGHGLTVEQISHIFEPFYTSKETGKGTGLGLAMVYGFITQSNGFVQVESQVGEGTIFKFFLPETAMNESVRLKETERPVESAKMAKLLVVDDERPLLESTSRLLEKAGYKVTMAESAEEALEILEHETFDLVFTDVVMQGELTGIDLVIQAHQKYPDLRFVVGTGYSERLFDSSELQWLRESLILKPYREAELLKVIYHSLQSSSD